MKQHSVKKGQQVAVFEPGITHYLAVGEVQHVRQNQVTVECPPHVRSCKLEIGSHPTIHHNIGANIRVVVTAKRLRQVQ